MKRFVALILSTIISVVPLSSALANHLDYDKLVLAAGCHAQVVKESTKSIGKSSYSHDEDGAYVYIGTRGNDVPEYAEYIILFHETGHCLQDESNEIDGMTTLQMELDADRQAANIACKMGMDGRKMLIDTLDWMLKKYKYRGDPEHGSINMRKAMAKKAEACSR